MRLIRLQVKNFRSLFDVELQGLKQFNVLIGKNNSGKSAFFGAIRFLIDVIHGKGLHNWNGNVLSNYSREAELVINMDFELSEAERITAIKLIGHENEKEFLDSAFGRHLHYSFRSFPGNPERLLLAETLIKDRRGKLILFQRGAYTGGTDLFGITVFPESDPASDEFRGKKTLVWPITSNIRFGWAENLDKNVASWPLSLLANFTKNAFFFECVRKFYNEQSVGGDGKLNPDGSNLVQVLNYWSNTKRPLFEKVQKFAQHAFAGVGGLETPFSRATQQNIHAAFRLRDEENQIPLQNMGGGVPQILMIAIALETTPTDCPLFIEEPETNIHPGAQRFLAERLCEEKRQVFITTHSPTFLNLPHLKSVHKISMSDGKTNVVSLNNDNLHIALSDIGARNSDVLLSDAVIFVEGESDLQVFQEWCRTFEVELIGTNTSILTMNSFGRPEVGVPIRSETLKNVSTNAHIPHFFILDSDEMSEKTIKRLKDSLKDSLHILKKRELENYFLKVPVLKLAVREKLIVCGKSTSLIDSIENREIEKIIRNTIENLKNRILVKRIRSLLPTPAGGFFPREIFDGFEASAMRQTLSQKISKSLTDHYSNYISKKKIEVLVKAVRKKFEREWKNGARKLEVAPGEEVISAIFDRFDLEYNKTTDAIRIAKLMKRDDFDEEIIQLMEKIRGMAQNQKNMGKK